AYAAELAFWEKVSRAKQPGPLEDYLLRYPSGHFAELAQHELDALLASQGEKKVEIAPQAQNPYTQGTARADTGYKVGDSYSYNRIDRETGELERRYNYRVTAIGTEGVMVNDGAIIWDRLGNLLKQVDG